MRDVPPGLCTPGCSAPEGTCESRSHGFIPLLMIFTRIHADDRGVSHFAAGRIDLFERGPIGRLSEAQPGAGLIFRETEGSYDYDWHQAPRRQWIVLLDGEIEIETGDGEVRRFRGGDILLVEDTHGRGHRTRQLSAGVRRSLFIPVPETALSL